MHVCPVLVYIIHMLYFHLVVSTAFVFVCFKENFPFFFIAGSLCLVQYPNKVVPLCSRWRVALFLKCVHVQACVQEVFCTCIVYIYMLYFYHVVPTAFVSFFLEFPIVLRFSIAGPLCLVQYPSGFMPLYLWRRISLLLKFLLTV